MNKVEMDIEKDWFVKFNIKLKFREAGKPRSE